MNKQKEFQVAPGPNGEMMVKVDGRNQVLEMLRSADPEFREILLRGIEKRDPRLARSLRLEL